MQSTRKISKYFSYILRHHPEAIGITLDDEGWAQIDELIEKTKKFKLTMEMIQTVVDTNDKKRFTLSSDKRRIKANQGHSIEVDLALEPIDPPDFLLHGTAQKSIESIMDKGILKGQRHHVHLSETKETAFAVGQRYGKPVLLKIDSNKMAGDGFKFYKSLNGVWLVEGVPPRYIEIITN
ncbi:MAG: RNA 2'-phosphotransferase [Desulfobacterales bacterium]|nr:RNA 2'-phosphotransferase [Desulfobacterales bacterium]MCP4163805.1 RNA 2'-phosphotransferase [Deltaproteobacteria bacterium]